MKIIHNTKNRKTRHNLSKSGNTEKPLHWLAPIFISLRPHKYTSVCAIVCGGVVYSYHSPIDPIHPSIDTHTHTSYYCLKSKVNLPFASTRQFIIDIFCHSANAVKWMWMVLCSDRICSPYVQRKERRKNKQNEEKKHLSIEKQFQCSVLN